jgi:hypothetical protein
MGRYAFSNCTCTARRCVYKPHEVPQTYTMRPKPATTSRLPTLHFVTGSLYASNCALLHPAHTGAPAAVRPYSWPPHAIQQCREGAPGEMSCYRDATKRPSPQRTNIAKPGSSTGTLPDKATTTLAQDTCRPSLALKFGQNQRPALPSHCGETQAAVQQACHAGVVQLLPPPSAPFRKRLQAYTTALASVVAWKYSSRAARLLQHQQLPAPAVHGRRALHTQASAPCAHAACCQHTPRGCCVHGWPPCLQGELPASLNHCPCIG